MSRGPGSQLSDASSSSLGPVPGWASGSKQSAVRLGTACPPRPRRPQLCGVPTGSQTSSWLPSPPGPLLPELELAAASTTEGSVITFAPSGMAAWQGLGPGFAGCAKLLKTRLHFSWVYTQERNCWVTGCLCLRNDQTVLYLYIDVEGKEMNEKLAICSTPR